MTRTTSDGEKRRRPHTIARASSPCGRGGAPLAQMTGGAFPARLVIGLLHVTGHADRPGRRHGGGSLARMTPGSTAPCQVQRSRMTARLWSVAGRARPRRCVMIGVARSTGLLNRSGERRRVTGRAFHPLMPRVIEAEHPRLRRRPHRQAYWHGHTKRPGKLSRLVALLAVAAYGVVRVVARRAAPSNVRPKAAVCDVAGMAGRAVYRAMIRVSETSAVAGL